MDKFGMLLVLLSVTVFSVFFSDAYGQNVLTYTPVTVTSSSAVLRGSVSGEAVASEKGFEWKVSSETSGYTKVKSDGSNPMTYKLTGLAPMTTYSFRTYAIYGGQEKYGETYSFTTVSDNFMDGSNLGLMMSEEPNFLGWKARLGAYTTKPNLPPYEITKTFFNFNSTVEDIYGEYDDPSKAVAGFGRHYVEIKTDTNEFDKNSMQKLKTIPTHLGYERSMFFGNTNYGDDATEVYYDFTVRSDMSLVTIVYTIVLQTPHPGEKFINPAFEIEVLNNNTGERLEDCLFFQMCGDIPNSSTLPEGWHSGGSWAYCDWQQIKINLYKYDGQNVRIRARVSGCAYGAHPGYGYIACKIEPPAIFLAGCAGEGDTVNKAEAPSGFDTYEWYEIPYVDIDQSYLASQYEQALNAGKIISQDRILAVTSEMMADEHEKRYAVKLTAPVQHVEWDKSPAPACEAYIPIAVNDMRPDFTAQQLHQYTEVNPEEDENEIGFLFDDVKARSEVYPLDWQRFEFGDGYALEVKLDKGTNKWSADTDVTPLEANRVRIAYKPSGDIDTVFHIYDEGDFLYRRIVHAYSVSNELECEKNDILNVHVGVRPGLIITSPDTVCVGDRVTFEASSPGEDASNYIYQWWHGSDNEMEDEPFFTGTSFVIDTLDKDTVFHVKVTNPDGNGYTWRWDTVRVQPYPDIVIDGDSLICLGQDARFVARDICGYNQAMKWTFKPPVQSELDGAEGSPALFEQLLRTDTTVYILAQTTKRCFAWRSVGIKLVVPKVSSDKSRICPGETVTLFGSGAAEYSWVAAPFDSSLNEGVKSTDPVQVMPQETTTYTMSGYGDNGCEATTTIKITVIPYPEAIISFNPPYVDFDNPVLLLVDSSSTAYHSVWTFSDGGQANGVGVQYEFLDLSQDEVGIHLVSSNELGCSSEADTTAPVVLFSVWMPNAFTPDGDGMNDYFFFRTSNDLYDVSFNIYNRWGTHLYSYETPEYIFAGEDDIVKYGWNGKHKDAYVSNGTYVWTLSYKRKGSTKVYYREGSLAVVR